jgi:hypothetical protein
LDGDGEVEDFEVVGAIGPVVAPGKDSTFSILAQELFGLLRVKLKMMGKPEVCRQAGVCYETAGI